MFIFPLSWSVSAARAAALAGAAGLACVLAMLLPAPAGAAEPGRAAQLARPLSAEERLDAIRRGLVQAALEGATRVESVAWLDEEGRLHESSSFRSGMQVRGVQVLAYLRDREGQPQAQLSLPPATSEASSTQPVARRDLVKNVEPAPAAGSCGTHSHRLRHLVGLELAVGGRWSAQDAPLAQSVAALAGTVWLQAPVPEATVWRMLAAGDGVVKTDRDQPRTLYEQILLGSAATPLPWLARLKVIPGPLPAAPLNPFLKVLPGTPSAPVSMARITLSLEAVRPSSAVGQPPTALSLSADVPLSREPGQWGAPQLTPAARAQVLALLASWSQAFNDYLACQTVQPDVVASTMGALRMNAGELAGVQPGEEWLLADPQAFPGRLLAPGSAQQLVLAKVLKVNARHAELQVLAGPAQPVQPGWRAWRAESPLQNLQNLQNLPVFQD